MKSLVSIFTIALIAGCVSGQSLKESEVPAAVISALHKILPDVKDYDWYLEDGNYEAEYDANDMESAATFDKDGNLLETEREIEVKELPANCSAYVAKNYPGLSIREASEITDSKGAKTFEAELKGKDVIFDANGNFLNEEK